MGLGEWAKVIRDISSAVYRIEKLEGRLLIAEDKIALLTKDNEHFTQKEITLNRKQIKIAREIQHKLIRDVYDTVMLKVNKLHDNEADPNVAKTITTQAIEHYYHVMERTHLEEGTHPKLISIIIRAMKPAILHIMESYGEEYEKLFTSIKNGTRRLALKNATDLYHKELCLKFDEELYDIIELAEEF